MTTAYRLRLRLALALYHGPGIRSRLAYHIDPRKAHFNHKRRRIGQ